MDKATRKRAGNQKDGGGLLFWEAQSLNSYSRCSSRCKWRTAARVTSHNLWISGRFAMTNIGPGTPSFFGRRPAQEEAREKGLPLARSVWICCRGLAMWGRVICTTPGGTFVVVFAF